MPQLDWYLNKRCKEIEEENVKVKEEISIETKRHHLNIKIVANKPLPKRAIIGQFDAIARKMAVGDCVEGFPNLVTAQNLMRAMKKKGYKCSIRKLEEANYGVWRIE